MGACRETEPVYMWRNVFGSCGFGVRQIQDLQDELSDQRSRRTSATLCMPGNSVHWRYFMGMPDNVPHLPCVCVINSYNPFTKVMFRVAQPAGCAGLRVLIELDLMRPYLKQNN